MLVALAADNIVSLSKGLIQKISTILTLIPASFKILAALLDSSKVTPPATMVSLSLSLDEVTLDYPTLNTSVLE